MTKRKRVTRGGVNSNSLKKKSLKENSLEQRKQMLMEYLNNLQTQSPRLLADNEQNLESLMGKMNSSKKNEEKEFGFLKLEERKPKKNFIAPWGEIIYHKKKTLKI
jgi:hypothetical protein